MTATTVAYRYDGPHLDDLADGRQLEPGRLYDLTADEVADPHNQQRIAAGLLVQIQSPVLDATPDAVELAAENAVDLPDVDATGAGGRITKADVEKHLKNRSVS